LENTLLALRDGLPCTTAYETAFLIQWPDHLGGGTVEVVLEGSMGLVPVMGMT